MISVSPIWPFLVSLTYISNILVECTNCEPPYNNCVGPFVNFLVVMFFYGYGKVKWSHYRPGVAQRVGRGVALLFHDRGTRRGWVVSSTPRPHFTPGKDPVPIVQEAGWASGPVWFMDMVGKIISFHAKHFSKLFKCALYIYIYIYMCVCVCVCVCIYLYLYTYISLTFKNKPLWPSDWFFRRSICTYGGITKRVLSFCIRSSNEIQFSESLFRRVRNISESDISFVMSVRPFVRLSEWNNSAPTWRIFTKVDIWVFFQNLSRKFKFY